MSASVPVIHYLNQFFGQVGGEDQAQVKPHCIKGPVGPGRALQEYIAEWGEVVATIVCGDNYGAENPETVAGEVIDLIAPFQPALLMAGPAFSAGRYGLACGEVCRQTQNRLGIPALAGMDPEQPAVKIYRRDVLLVQTGGSARHMTEALKRMAHLGRKLATGTPLGRPDEDGYVSRGIRRNVIGTRLAADRAVDMLVTRLRGEPVITEVELPAFEEVPAAAPLADLASATIVLITTGGIVPRGNPDRLSSTVAKRYGKYSLDGVDDLDGSYQVHHGGYFPGHCSEDPDRMIPVDAMRELERDAVIGRLHPHYYTLAGAGTYPEAATVMGRQIAVELRAGGVTGAILTST